MAYWDRFIATTIRSVTPLLLGLASITAPAQKSEQAKTASKIGVFPLSAFESPPPLRAPAPDTANIKPENFKFPIINREDIRDRLEKGVLLPKVDCKTYWGLFIFRVNL